MQDNVGQFKVGGGGGPEAMCCAMAAAAEMSWNRNSRQIVILIGDQPPHGYTYDGPCECGHDTLRVTHTMAKNGIVVYPVDCGRPNGERQTFYHGLARITGGYAFDIKDAGLLPEIVIGASAEEGMMEKLTEVVEPLYQECVRSHRLGRFEQHCQAVYAECVAKNVTTESAMPGDGYSKQEEKQVDCLSFCTDIAQAKAMREREYFGIIKRSTKLCSYMQRPVTLSQVTTCMKRMKEDIRKKAVLQFGCQYLSQERFSEAEFKARWKTFKEERKIGQFTPWNKLTRSKAEAYSKIPDAKVVKPKPSGPLPIRVEAEKKPITHQLIGRNVEIKLYDVWTRVKILKVLKENKVLVQCQDFEFPVEHDNEWRASRALAAWAKKKEEAPKCSPLLLEKLRAMTSKNSTKKIAKVVESNNQEKKKVEPARPAPATSRPVSFAQKFGPSRPTRVASRRVPAVEKVKPRAAPVASRRVPAVEKAEPSRTAPVRSRRGPAVKTAEPSRRAPVASRPVPAVRKAEPSRAAPVRSRRASLVENFEPSRPDPFRSRCVPAVQNAESSRSAPVASRPSPVNMRAQRSATADSGCSSPSPEAHPEVLPSVNVFHVPDNLTSRDLAILCMDQGVTPMKIQKVRTQYGVVAVISFGTHGEARRICDLRRFSLAGSHTHLPIQWSEKYLKTTTTRL